MDGFVDQVTGIKVKGLYRSLSGNSGKIPNPQEIETEHDKKRVC